MFHLEVCLRSVIEKLFKKILPRKMSCVVYGMVVENILFLRDRNSSFAALNVVKNTMGAGGQVLNNAPTHLLEFGNQNLTGIFP